MDAILENQRSEWLNKFSTNSQLTEFVKELMDWDKLLLVKRQMLRNALPGSDHVPVHYDQLYFRQGPPTFITCWTPFDDTAPNRGGLMYLSDSSKLGEGLENDFNERAQGMTREQRESAFNANMVSSLWLYLRFQTGSSNLLFGPVLIISYQMQGGIIHPDADVFAAGHGRQWLMTDYQIGDVAFHNPFIIHASCVNSDPSNRIMVHTDIRFVHPEQPYDQRWHEYWARQSSFYISLSSPLFARLHTSFSVEAKMGL
jgi:phytanoyl-CoA hydroxylase